jgi:hypothetical protein
MRDAVSGVFKSKKTAATNVREEQTDNG